MSNDLSFAAAYEEFKQLTAEFEKSDLDLEAAIPKFKRAAELAKLLKTRLKDLQTQIEEINLDVNQDDASTDINF